MSVFISLSYRIFTQRHVSGGITRIDSVGICSKGSESNKEMMNEGNDKVEFYSLLRSALIEADDDIL